MEGLEDTGAMSPGLVHGVQGVGAGLAVPGLWGGMEGGEMGAWRVKGFRDGGMEEEVWLFSGCGQGWREHCQVIATMPGDGTGVVGRVCIVGVSPALQIWGSQPRGRLPQGSAGGCSAARLAGSSG